MMTERKQPPKRIATLIWLSMFQNIQLQFPKWNRMQESIGITSFF